MSTAATPSWRIIVGDCREALAALPEGSVHTCVTSPPYFGLRDYGTGEWEGGDADHDHHGTHGAGGGSSRNGAGRAGMGGQEHVNGAPNRGGDPTRCPCGARRVDRQIGLEPTPDEFVEALVTVFREVRRVLRDDGTVWLNLGDSYAGSWGAQGRPNEESLSATQVKAHPKQTRTGSIPAGAPYKPKDLIGVPWMVAFALRADGWYLRSDVIWAKPNPMPESVTDRPTRAHEQIFLLSKSPRYFYDADAIREPDKGTDHPRSVLAGQPSLDPSGGVMAPHRGLRTSEGRDGRGANKRDVWTVSAKPYSGAHFATFPPDLIEPCVLAGAPERACERCGAPWRRILDVEPNPAGINGKPGMAYSKGTPETTVSRGEKIAGRHVYRQATFRGFEPTCECAAETVPGVVLDPFAGAGTTGVVALRHGRSFVGVELNPEYAELARERIRDDAPLLNGAAEAAAA